MNIVNNLSALIPWYEKLKEASLPIYIYGMGNGCEKVLAELDRHGLTCSGIFTSDDFKREREFNGFRLITLSELEAKKIIDFSVVLAFGTDIPEVMERIEGIAKTHLLVCPDTPVAGEVVFDRNVLLARGDDIQTVYDILEDNKSREFYINILKFKITGDIAYLRDHSDKTEPFELLSLGSNETYCDLGAYTGDTVEEFISNTCALYNHIYAVEPSKKNFQKCLRNTDKLKNLTLINAAISDSDRETFFTSGAGRQQTITQNGIQTAVRSLDSILDGKQATYIKYDVEGEESNALIGSKETIMRYFPKLRISIYHRPYDIIDIPLLIKKLNSGYKLYIRRQRYYPAWDTELIAVK